MRFFVGTRLLRTKYTPYLFLELNRFREYKDKEIIIPNCISLPNKLQNNCETRNYKLHAAIIHKNMHYISFVCREDEVICIDDLKKESKIFPKKVFEQELIRKNGYLFVYILENTELSTSEKTHLCDIIHQDNEDNVYDFTEEVIQGPDLNLEVITNDSTEETNQESEINFEGNFPKFNVKILNELFKNIIQNVKKVVFPDSVEIIGKKIFYNYNNINEVQFTENSKLRVIKFAAFSQTLIEKFVAPIN